MNIFRRLLQWSIPSAVFFEDGSRIDYLTKSNTLVYVSGCGDGIRMPVECDATNGKLQVVMPVSWKWNKPAGSPISDEEVKVIKIRIAEYVRKQGKPFSLGED